MRYRKNISKRINKASDYHKTTLEGIVLYVDPLERWCNVELMDGNILYHIYFGEGVNPRLRRESQPVTLIQTIGGRYKYIVVGAGRRRIITTTFEPLGTFLWDDGTLWDDRHVWA